MKLFGKFFLIKDGISENEIKKLNKTNKKRWGYQRRLPGRVLSGEEQRANFSPVDPLDGMDP